MLGDFDQQPPIGGLSLPHLATTLLEKEYYKKNNIFYTSKYWQEKVKINITICHRRVGIFQQAGHINPSIQHRCANDPEQISNLIRINTKSKMTPLELHLYKILSCSDLKYLDKLLHTTIIATGDYEFQKLNTFITSLLARNFCTHVIRRKMKIKHNKWKCQPSTKK